MGKTRRLLDVYRFPGCRPKATITGICGDPKARIIRLERRQKKRYAGVAGPCTGVRTTARRGVSGPSPAGIRGVTWTWRCGKVKRERLDWLADNPFYTKRFVWFVGRRCRAMSIKDVAKDVHLDWHTVKGLEQQYMAEQLRRTGVPAPKAIGIDEISLRKGHTYRIVVSDLERRRPIWFGGQDRSEASLDGFYHWLGEKKCAGIRLAVMDMWKAFEKSTQTNVPPVAIVYDKFHVMRHLGIALDTVRKMEYRRLAGKDRSYIKGQKYTLLSNRAHLTLWLGVRH